MRYFLRCINFALAVANSAFPYFAFGLYSASPIFPSNVFSLSAVPFLLFLHLPFVLLFFFDPSPPYCFPLLPTIVLSYLLSPLLFQFLGDCSAMACFLSICFPFRWLCVSDSRFSPFCSSWPIILICVVSFLSVPSGLGFFRGVY